MENFEGYVRFGEFIVEVGKWIDEYFFGFYLGSNVFYFFNGFFDNFVGVCFINFFNVDKDC